MFLAIVSLIFCSCAPTQKFLRPLPSQALQDQLTQKRFPNDDAVIILKEQSMILKRSTEFYRGMDITGLNTVHNKVLIVKLFNDAAVKRYGTFSFTYADPFSDQFPNGFGLKVRILKPSGEVYLMPKEEIQRIDDRKNSLGQVLSKKIICKIPNLAAGDILQLESSFVETFSIHFSERFYYNDQDPIIFSNLYITMPKEFNFDFTTLPKNVIGPPKIVQMSKQYGAGKTYFWSKKNLAGIPSEPYMKPFDNQSLITAFVVTGVKTEGLTQEMGTWSSETENFYKNYISSPRIKQKHLEQLGYSVPPSVPQTKSAVDSLYFHLRKYFQLYQYSMLVPLSDDLDYLFEQKQADASDLAFIMFDILKSWNVPVSMVMIRDKRKGDYLLGIPGLGWFDRLGVLVGTDIGNKLYDFDRSIPYHYKPPWFINNSLVLKLNNSEATHHRYDEPRNINDHGITESHHITFQNNMTYTDSVAIAYNGFFSEDIRDALYDVQEDGLNKFTAALLSGYGITQPEHIALNKFKEIDPIQIQAISHSDLQIDSLGKLLMFHPSGHVLTEFRDQIYTPYRHNDLILPAPSRLTETWSVVVPQSLVPVVDDSSAVLSGPMNIRAVLSWKLHGNILDISCITQFPKIPVPKAQFKDLITFLNTAEAASKREIVFRKL